MEMDDYFHAIFKVSICLFGWPREKWKYPKILLFGISILNKNFKFVVLSCAHVCFSNFSLIILNQTINGY